MSANGWSSNAADTGGGVTWKQLESWCRAGEAKQYAAEAVEAYHGKTEDYSWAVAVAAGLIIAIPVYSWLIAAAHRLGAL